MRISKAEAAKIGGISPKTLEKIVKDPEAAKALGYGKAINGRVYFDAEKFRGAIGIYSEKAESGEIENNAEILESPIITIEAESLNKDITENTAMAIREKPELSIFPFIPAAAGPLIESLFNMRFYDLDEAAQITKLPKSYIRKFGQKRGSKIMFSKKELEGIK